MSEIHRQNDRRNLLRPGILACVPAACWCCAGALGLFLFQKSASDAIAFRDECLAGFLFLFSQKA
jgi:hypothetical protein